MPLTVPTVAEVRGGVVNWLRLPQTETTGDNGKTLDTVCASARAYVRRLPIVHDSSAEDDDAAEDVRLGVIMLAARLHRRRNSPGGIEAMTEAGATYVARHDADVSRLLRLDSYQSPQVG